MNLRRLLPSLAGATLALGLTWAWAVAQEPPSAPTAPASPQAAPVAPAPADATEVPAEPELRRLDEAPAAAAEAAEAEAEATATSAEESVQAAEAEVEEAKEAAEEARHSGPGHGREVVQIGGDALLAAGESAHQVVAVMGDVVVDGTVQNGAVAVMGDTTVNGSSSEAVAVLGNVTINGEVRGQVVAVLGNVQLGPRAVVHGELVCVGGRIDRAPGAVVHGPIQHVGPFPIVADGLDGLKVWFRECLLYARPLAFDSRLLWAWGIAGAFLLFYLFIALAFNRSVVTCARTLEERPGMTLVATVLTALLLPILTVLLSFIGVGLLLIPLTMLAGLYGKTVFLAWLGRRATLPLGVTHSFLAVLVGGVIVLLLYTVPYFGFVFMKLTGALGLGMVVYTIILTTRRPPAPAPVLPVPVAAPVSPGSTVAATAPAAATTSGFVADSGPAVGADPTITGAAPEPVVSGAPSFTPPPVPLAAAAAAPAAAVVQFSTLPRVGFWLRLAASLLDAILVAVALKLVGLGDYFPLGFATYCVVLWALRGTTIGGVICGLKVVRLDDRKVDWTVAIVRALGGFLSLAVAGLGFIWVAFDPDVQSWHDKIAGTTIVRVPKGVSLV